MMIIQYIGSKEKITPWIMKHVPEHKIFVDVFGGSGAVILNKPKSKIEIYNDIDGNLVNLFEVIRTRKEEFKEQLRYLLYSRELFNRWRNNIEGDELERAVRFFLVMNARFSGDRDGGFSTSRSKNEAEKFRSRCDRIDEVAERFKDVIIENLHYQDVIKKYDSEDTVFYCDPPYFFEDIDNVYYSERWNIDEHKYFAYIVNNVKGKVLISYYNFKYIEKWYKGWYIDKLKVTKSSQNSLYTDGKKDEVYEILLMNYDYTKIKPFYSCTLDKW